VQVLNGDGLAEFAPLLPEMTNVVSFFLDDPHALLPALQLFCAVIITPHTHAAHADAKAAPT